ncbi:hypothetical protein NEICINOT_03823 [Neisseria cinerea ATCC 14685]|uniref:Uncharacterized protein n=1 Tax=Neisseria cinerea ATCC 14685 TaxID=546262 RepID=D0W2D9_NEICI|nr:hypothetical protein NEICINOT_03823 [Neisseria cinerea ATCC 14685]
MPVFHFSSFLTYRLPRPSNWITCLPPSQRQRPFYHLNKGFSKGGRRKKEMKMPSERQNVLSDGILS